ncbi:MAG: class I SAM-dependent methyltransferase [Coriobacteriia bacterium]|nr:class I SAM-dependent methyltransferase [Coriobacteriia bacterium]
MPNASLNPLCLWLYGCSFSRHLGLSIGADIAGFTRSVSLEEYLRERQPLAVADSVRDRLNAYRSRIAPAVKARPLLALIEREGIRPETVVDFGCGDGTTLQYLTAQIPSLRQAYGVDVDLGVIQLAPLPEMRGQVRCEWFTALDNIPPVLGSPRLLIAIHVLHHLSRDEQSDALRRLARLMDSPSDLLYVVEDSWSDQLQTTVSCRADQLFVSMDVRGKSAVFESNEYWSNAWCYGRRLGGSCSRRSSEEWTRLAKEAGLTVVWSRATGFALDRLHGVPAVAFIATRAD